MSHHITNQVLREMGADAIRMREEDGILSDNEIILALYTYYLDAEVEAYAALQSCYFATYAAYSIGKAEEVAAAITETFSEDGDRNHNALFNRYFSQIDINVADHITCNFDRELARYGRRIVDRIAGNCSAILAD